MPQALSDKQIRFRDAYLETNNSISAYRKAGYVTATEGEQVKWLRQRAFQVLTTPSMQGAIVLARQEVKQHKQVTADWVQDKLVIEYETALIAEDRPNALRALELIGKTCNAFTENLNISTDQRRDYDELELVELKRISKLLLQPRELPILDAVATEPEDAS